VYSERSPGENAGRPHVILYGLYVPIPGTVRSCENRYEKKLFHCSWAQTELTFLAHRGCLFVSLVHRKCERRVSSQNLRTQADVAMLLREYLVRSKPVQLSSTSSVEVI
jgi:hypothetical protein